MFGLRNAFRTLNVKSVSQLLRKYSTKVESEGSVRQQLWFEHRKIYSHCPEILYSSIIENDYQIPYNKQNQVKFNSKWQEYENQSVVNKAPVPKNWMHDYEFYDGGIDEEGNINSTHGTSDASVKPSDVPCGGCGAHLHCASPSLPGFLPVEIFYGRTNEELKTIVCQRCHFLEHYNIALDVEVTADTYVQTISRIKEEFALAILIVDLLDFPCSIWPEMQNLLGNKRPVVIVGNKVDLLPRDSNSYLNHIQNCLKQQLLHCGFQSINLKYIGLISAKTGYGVEELITQLHKIWKYKGDVYLMGCTNVGKSSLFNILLNSDYCRPYASDLLRKATTCPWPGTTLQMLKFPIYRPSEHRIYERFRRLYSERSQKSAVAQLRRDQALKTGSIQSARLIGKVGRTYDSREDVQDAFSMSKGTNPILTINERSLQYKDAKWCFDTPGVMHPAQITNLLTTEELLLLEPSQMIQPRALRFKPGMTVFLAGLGRLDFVNHKRLSLDKQLPTADWIKIFIFSSLKLPLLVTETKDAADVYKKYLGQDILGIPFGNQERLMKWPGLQNADQDIIIEGSADTKNALTCDILLSSAGWVGISVPAHSECTFRAWTPHARGIFERSPALIPLADRLVGKRIRNSLGYNLSRPFVFKK